MIKLFIKVFLVLLVIVGFVTFANNKVNVTSEVETIDSVETDNKNNIKFIITPYK